VVLISVAESLDTGSAAGRLVITIMAAVSRWEREAIGERRNSQNSDWAAIACAWLPALSTRAARTRRGTQRRLESLVRAINHDAAKWQRKWHAAQSRDVNGKF
jgi:hypothetical protein